MNEFSVTILGSSAATPTSTRFPSAQVVSHQFRPFLVDCGEGTQMQIRKNKIRFSKINHIFISHTHGDHFFGLIGLISSLNLLGRENDLHIYAPENIKAVLDLQLAVSESQLRYQIHYHFLKFDGKHLLYEDKHLEIYSFPLHHSIPTCGFLFKEKPHPRKIRKDALKTYAIPDLAFEGIKQGDDFVKSDGEIVSNETLTLPGMDQKSYAYCSDTAYFKGISDYIMAVDLLYHECSFMEDMRKTAEAKMHSTTFDAARVANDIGAKRLIIGHFSARYKELEPVLVETQTVFENTTLAIEDLKIKV
jgi:ribonuclease Z